MKKSVSVPLVVVVALALMALMSPFSTAWAAPIKLRAVSFIPVQAMMVHMMGEYAKRVNDRAKGELVIEWVGGPDVIPTPLLAEAVTKGRVDMMIQPASALLSVAPQLYCMQLSEFNPMEERKNGAFEFYQRFFEKGKYYYLGRATSEIPSYFFTNFPVKTPKDFSGHRMGAISFTIEVIKNLGATPVNVPKTEWYTSVERNVVDGYALPVVNVPTYGLIEVTKFMIDHPFQQTTELLFAMNLDKYKGLPKHLQKVLNDVAMEMEPDVMTFFKKESQTSLNKMQNAGMKFVKFSPEDAKGYLDIINNTWWEEFKGMVSPEVFSEAKKTILKR